MFELLQASYSYSLFEEARLQKYLALCLFIIILFI